MKKNIALVILLCVFTQGWTQTKNIEFKVDKEPNALAITGYNNTDEALEITLTIKDIKLLKGYTKPIVKVVPAKSNVLFKNLRLNMIFISINFLMVSRKYHQKLIRK